MRVSIKISVDWVGLWAFSYLNSRRWEDTLNLDSAILGLGPGLNEGEEAN